MKSRLFAITLIIIASITIFSFVGWFILKPEPVLMQGEVAARSVKVSSQMAGRIDSLMVRQGDVVNKGDFLYRIKSNTVRAKLTQAEAVKRAAAAQSTKVDNGLRKQMIDQAYEMWQKSLVGLDLAEKTYARVKNLYTSGVVPAQKLDEVEAQYKAAKATVVVAEAQYSMAREGAQWEDKAAAAALVAQAGGAVAEVESYLDDAAQYAPVSGEISSVISQCDELVGAGYPVITIVDLSDNWIVFNLKETLLPKIQKGKRLSGYVPALDMSVEMEVSFIAAEASYATWAATRTSGEFDVRTFEVQCRPLVPLEGLRPGMSVTVDYDTL